MREEEYMFQPVEENVSVYKKIIEQIQELIASGELKKGDKLPPERQMAEMLGVGRPAVKQAISALEALGIVKSRQGDGNYITMSSDTVFNPLALRFYLDNGNFEHILEFRYILEVQMASLAAKKITKEQIDEFSAFMEEMKQNVPDRAPLELRQKYNNEFHYRLVSICDNQLIENIFASLIGLIGDQIIFTDGSDFYSSHEKIFKAVKEGNAAAAATCMATHFQDKFPNYRYYADIHRAK